MTSNHQNTTTSKNSSTSDEPAQHHANKRLHDFYADMLDSVMKRQVFKAARDPPGTNLQLIHITKTGGTALEKWGLKHGYSWGYFWSELVATGENGSPITYEPWHTPPRLFRKNPYAGHTLFAVVRDPYTRIISEFRCPFTGYHAADDGQRAKATANDLNKWITEKLNQGAARPPFVNVGHLVPQHFYIFNGHGRRHVKEINVLRAENLASSFADLRKRYNMPGDPLERINESKMKKFWIEDLWEATRELIEREYKLDFERFGYKKFSERSK